MEVQNEKNSFIQQYFIKLKRAIFGFPFWIFRSVLPKVKMWQKRMKWLSMH